MRRVISVWLPTLPTDRLRRRREKIAGRPGGARDKALIIVAAAQGTERVAAACVRAQGAGIAPGMTAADARALLPELEAVPADPQADTRLLVRLADWADRYTPWVATDEGEGSHGLLLDVTGCAHLFGGERALLDDLLARLRAQGLACRAALAGTPGAAWALARFGHVSMPGRPAPPPGHPQRTIPLGGREGERAGAAQTENSVSVIVPTGGQRAALAPLPVRSLRLEAAAEATLNRLGLRRVGELYAMARGGLARRLGAPVLRRLDQALGRLDEPISPRRRVPAFRERLAFAEPIARQEDVAEAARRLLVRLCRQLERAHRGARRLELALFHLDGSVSRVAIGTSRPARDPVHLARLFAERLEGVEPGLGIEIVTLDARVVDPLTAWQLTIGGKDGATDDGALGRLIDRLGNRLGAPNVHRLAPVESHLPERAVRAAPPFPAKTAPIDAPWILTAPRPLRLLARPEPIQALAEIPDGPPARFRWRRVLHRVAAAEGPERIAPEWWRERADWAQAADAETRDYFRVEDLSGARFWLFRRGLYRPRNPIPPRWYLHGIFS